MKLIYIGNGFLPGIPARDLTAGEAQEYGADFLVSTGLYMPEETEEDNSDIVPLEEDNGN